MKKTFYLPVIVISLFAIVVFVINNVNHNFEMNDFKVYYFASDAIIHGKQLYWHLFTLGSGYYKYSPFTALLFCPYIIMPYYMACTVHFFLTSLSIVLISLLLFNIFRTYIFTDATVTPALIIILSLVCVVNHLIRELTMGNVNVILALMLIYTLALLLKGKTIAPASLLAAAIITKPFFILLLAPLLLHKYYKVLIYSFLFILSFCILPALISGFGNNFLLQKEWLNTVFLHANTFPSSNMLISIINTYAHINLPQKTEYLLILAVIGARYFFARKLYSETITSQADTKPQFIMEWFVVLAIIPSLFATDTEHFLMTWPLIMYLLFYLFVYKNKTILWPFITSILLFDGNSRDLIGNLTYKIDELGILGVGNLLLITITLVAFYKQIKQETKGVRV